MPGYTGYHRIGLQRRACGRNSFWYRMSQKLLKDWIK